MLLSDIDNWSVLALHQISTDLAAERITIDSLVDELDTIGQLPGWDSQAADQARNRLSTARTGLMEDRLVLQTVETLAEETATQLTGLKDELADIRQIVESHNGRMQLSDFGEVAVTESGRTISQFRAIAEELETRAKKLIADAEALDSDCAAVLNYLVGPQPLAYGARLGDDGMVYVAGTGGHDRISVNLDRETGYLVISVNDSTKSFDPADVTGVTIDSQLGDDIIDINTPIDGLYPTGQIPSGARPGVRVNAGAGNDRITGGSGRDYLNGGTGDDIIDGAGGNDVIYGGEGVDILGGDYGDDYLDGGNGADVIYGGVDNDLLHGGKGNDRLFSNAGNDTVITGEGRDWVVNQWGDDVTMAQVSASPDGQPEDVITPVATAFATNDVTNTELVDIQNINVSERVAQGHPEFTQRLWDDLELFRSTPAGQEMLENLGNSGYNTIVLPSPDHDSYAIPPGMPFEYANDLYQLPDQAVILYNTETVDVVPVTDPQSGNVVGETAFTPVATLFHEMAHIYDATNGGVTPGDYTGSDPIDRASARLDPLGNVVVGPVPNAERVAVGLPFDTDGDGDEEMSPDQPVLLTENALRAELGLELRDTYGFGVPK